jgi:uncharacterized protein YjbI with pentapeptide repeats
MIEQWIEEQGFKGVSYAGQKLPATEYDHCTFVNCDFSGTDLSNSDFVDCRFADCNFAMAKLTSSGLKTVFFENCKLIGINFDVCSDFLFAVGFKNCVLDYSSFAGRKMKKTTLTDCSLKEVDFSDADLSEISFLNCDLLQTLFSGCNLEKADFRTALNYSFDPDKNKIRKARFSYPGIIGLLSKYPIEIE